MDRKWTPGPWEAALERGCHGVIAKSLPEGGANFVALVGNDDNTPEREPVRFANAHLIAAAPDMYEALDRIQDELGCDDPECAMCILARAALAKARGEV